MPSLSPNFFILGAAKAGTTTLYEYLSQHEEIFLSQVKEPQFYCHEDLYRKGMAYYMRTFFKGSLAYPIRGEATPHYLYYEKVARRLSDTLPGDQLRFIVMLRDPTERAYSLYWNMVAESIETESFEKALELESERIKDSMLERSGAVSFQYFDSSLYAKQIETYLKYFARHQFLFVLFEHLRDNPFDVINESCDFLGVARLESLPNISNRNMAGMPKSIGLQRFLRGNSKIKTHLGRFLPHIYKYKLVETLLAGNKKRVRYPTLDKDTEAVLRLKFSSDVLKLQDITNKDLKDWLPR